MGWQDVLPSIQLFFFDCINQSTSEPLTSCKYVFHISAVGWSVGRWSVGGVRTVGVGRVVNVMTGGGVIGMVVGRKIGIVCDVDILASEETGSAGSGLCNGSA